MSDKSDRTRSKHIRPTKPHLKTHGPFRIRHHLKKRHHSNEKSCLDKTVNKIDEKIVIKEPSFCPTGPIVVNHWQCGLECQHSPLLMGAVHTCPDHHCNFCGYRWCGCENPCHLCGNNRCRCERCPECQQVVCICVVCIVCRQKVCICHKKSCNNSRHKEDREHKGNREHKGSREHNGHKKYNEYEKHKKYREYKGSRNDKRHNKGHSKEHSKGHSKNHKCDYCRKRTCICIKCTVCYRVECVCQSNRRRSRSRSRSRDGTRTYKEKTIYKCGCVGVCICGRGLPEAVVMEKVVIKQHIGETSFQRKVREYNEARCHCDNREQCQPMTRSSYSSCNCASLGLVCRCNY